MAKTNWTKYIYPAIAVGIVFYAYKQGYLNKILKNFTQETEKIMVSQDTVPALPPTGVPSSTSTPASPTGTTPGSVPTVPVPTQAVPLTPASQVYSTETMIVPSSVKTFIIYAQNAFHEDWATEKEKLVSDKNPYYVPRNTIISAGTGIMIHHADAPWDPPNPESHIVGTQRTAILNWGDTSQEFKLGVGNHKLTGGTATHAFGNIEVKAGQGAISNIIAGCFVTPTAPVANSTDPSGGQHPGCLPYFRTQFPIAKMTIVSTQGFSYAPGGSFFPDNRTGNHTLIVWQSSAPIGDVIAALKRFTKANPYV